jgi:4-alpha-glucanotransferase
MKFSHGDRRLCGIVAPLSALRTEASAGCGEFPDLARLGDLASAWGFDMVQLLPVNDSGLENSPYFALSAFALNPIYIRIGDLPELAGEAPKLLALKKEAEALVARFSGETSVPYEAVYQGKRDLLREIWSAVSPMPTGQALVREIDGWIEANPWSKVYAAFVALKARQGEKPWWEWSGHRDPARADIEALWKDAALQSELRFRAWLQMRAAEQFRSSSERLAAMGIALMGDIPILMNLDSADVWAERGIFRLELRAGSPPDATSTLGQNWGFPIYDWEALEREDFGFWRRRLAESDKYYSCYRIDHVLGFFRIWSLSERESSGVLGRFVPDVPIARAELHGLGFSPDRLRWLARPHVPTWRLVQASGESAAKAAASAALERIGDEELFLFKDSIQGEKDIEGLPSVSPAARDCLLAAWRDRCLFEYEPGSFVPTTGFRSTTSWASLSDQERGALERLFGAKRAQAESLWNQNGKRLLAMIRDATPMLPCAEDLGEVPDCVPVALRELGILSLRVLRWTRLWNENGQPFTPIVDYPELSVACPSVHDSASLREWWETEADRGTAWSFATVSLGRDLGPCPERLSAEQVESLLELVARSRSRLAAFPIQDLLAMSEKLRPGDPRQERINVPGTRGESNWSYRMPFPIDAVLGDKKLAVRARALAKARVSPGRARARKS